MLRCVMQLSHVRPLVHTKHLAHTCLPALLVPIKLQLRCTQCAVVLVEQYLQPPYIFWRCWWPIATHWRCRKMQLTESMSEQGCFEVSSVLVLDVVDLGDCDCSPSTEVFNVFFCSCLRQQRISLRTTKRSEEHTSELQSLMRISYAVFCLKKKHETQTS